MKPINTINQSQKFSPNKFRKNRSNWIP